MNSKNTTRVATNPFQIQLHRHSRVSPPRVNDAPTHKRSPLHHGLSPAGHPSAYPLSHLPFFTTGYPFPFNSIPFPSPLTDMSIDLTERRQLGRTGIEVSPLGFGAATLGNVFGHVNEQDGIDAVFEAIKRGINLFDTSPYYGITKSETVLGKALKQLPRDKFILSTKVGRYGENHFDFTSARVEKSITESMARLNVDYLDIVHCHDIEFANLDVVVEQAIPTLNKLKAAGKIRAISISGYPLEIFPYVLSATFPAIDVILSYCNYNLQNDRLEHLLPALKDVFNVGVINASPLCMGLLTPNNGPAWHPADEETKAHCRKASQYCVEHGDNLANVALKYAMDVKHKDCIQSTLVGIDSVKTLDLNCASIEELSCPLIEPVRGILAPVRNRRWDSGYMRGPSA